jgi:membrane fusion protein, multidrug efflux system
MDVRIRPLRGNLILDVRMRFIHLFAIALALPLASCSPSNGSEGAGKGQAAHGAPGAMPPAPVDAVTVAPRALPVAFEYTAQTAGSREVEVRARVTGILLKRNFEEGARVKQGQSLFSIDPAPYQAALARAEADVAAAEARAQQAARNAARLKPLYAEKAVSQKDFDDAASAEEIGAADVKAAKARLAEVRLSLGYTKVESPVSGIAGRALRSEGSLVSGPEVLLTTVVQVDPIWVNFGIPDNERARLEKEAQAGRLKLPKRFEVELRLADGSIHPVKGTLDFTDVRVSTATGTSEARAELPNPDGELRPGQFVRVILRGAERPGAILVPQRAVLEGPQGKFVYVISDKGAAEARPVQVGEWVGDEWIVTSGLQGGEQVITDGVMKIGPGAPVQVAQKPREEPKAAKK